MTRPFRVHYTCPHCGYRVTAETGFGRWMRAQSQLNSEEGLVRTDTDHTIHRYKTHRQGRDYQLLMDVETKEYGAVPSPSQRDTLYIKEQLQSANGRNMHGAVTRLTRRVYSIISGQRVRVRYLGSHLLVFEKTSPWDSAWMTWDGQFVGEDQLLAILAMDVDPYDLTRPMDELLRDRHARRDDMDMLFRLLDE